MHDIENQLIFPSNPGFIFHDSRGVESGSAKEFKIVKDFITRRGTEDTLKRRLHAIWYEYTYSSADINVLMFLLHMNAGIASPPNTMLDCSLRPNWSFLTRSTLVMVRHIAYFVMRLFSYMRFCSPHHRYIHQAWRLRNQSVRRSSRRGKKLRRSTGSKYSIPGYLPIRARLSVLDPGKEVLSHQDSILERWVLYPKTYLLIKLPVVH